MLGKTGFEWNKLLEYWDDYHFTLTHNIFKKRANHAG